MRARVLAKYRAKPKKFLGGSTTQPTFKPRRIPTLHLVTLSFEVGEGGRIERRDEWLECQNLPAAPPAGSRPFLGQWNKEAAPKGGGGAVQDSGLHSAFGLDRKQPVF